MNFSKKDFRQGESSKHVRCFECNKPCHIKTTWPFLKKNFKRSDPKKKAMMATWDYTDSSSSEKNEEHATNLCLMADLDKDEVFDFESEF